MQYASINQYMRIENAAMFVCWNFVYYFIFHDELVFCCHHGLDFANLAQHFQLAYDDG